MLAYEHKDVRYETGRKANDTRRGNHATNTRYVQIWGFTAIPAEQ